MLPVDDPILQIGDRLRIVCPEVPEICVDRAVGSDGTINIPCIGSFSAATRHMGELGTDVAAHLPGRLTPTIVKILWLGSDDTEIVVQGAVQRPLRLFVLGGVPQERLLDAAGLLPGADPDLLGAVRMVRPGTTLNVPYVTANRRIVVLGAVAKPTELPPSNALLLSSAIEAAGGLTPHSDPNALTIVRNEEPIPVTLPNDAGFLLRSGDVVRVGYIADRHYVTVDGLVSHPGKVEYAPGMTATRALTEAGGLLPDSTPRTLVWRTGSKTFRLSLAFIIDKRIPDPVLGPNDTLSIVAGKP